MTYKRYKKIVDCGTLPNNNTKTVAHGITGIVGVISIRGCAHNTVNGNFVPLPFVGSNIEYMVSVYINSTNISLTPLGNYSSYTESSIIIEYYKSS